MFSLVDNFLKGLANEPRTTCDKDRLHLCFNHHLNSCTQTFFHVSDGHNIDQTTKCIVRKEITVQCNIIVNVSKLEKDLHDAQEKICNQ